MKKVLIVVDYQNDFVDGSLGFDKALELETAIVDKIKEYRAEGHQIVFTLDTHPENYLDTNEGTHLAVEHCIKGTEGWDLYGEVAQYCDDSVVVFEKNTFGSLDLANYLAKEGYEEVELVGIVSNICVISNAVLAKAALPEANIIVDALCTASFDDELHEKALDVMQGLHIDVINR